METVLRREGVTGDMKPELATESLKIRASTKKRMDRVKLVPEETYDTVINRALDALEAKA